MSAALVAGVCGGCPDPVGWLLFNALVLVSGVVVGSIQADAKGGGQ